MIDWNSGLRNALAATIGTTGREVDREALLSAYHELEPVVQAEAHQSYRQVLRETARRTAERFSRSISEGAANTFADSLPNWLPFPDTNPSLDRLHAAGYRLGILSNVDNDLLAGTLRHISVSFDLIVTAEEVGSYKPAPAQFQTARERIGKATWLHAAQSYFHDVVPAHGEGIPVAWINRLHERPGGAVRPDRELENLSELANWLAP